MFGTYTRLNVPVWASDMTVIRAARRKIAAHHQNAVDKRDARKAFYRIMLEHHHSQQNLCREFRL